MSSRAPEEYHQPSHSSTPMPERKLAIPRLQGVGQGHGRTKDTHRVDRACTGVSVNRTTVPAQAADGAKRCRLSVGINHLVPLSSDRLNYSSCHGMVF
ncbi:hypothetical protein EJ02DRAFT_457480 [Clathrospora elynae]|uniref:Uncharacterized protein n=1 Tax=Clathrospora elynae TaxID=706981 RepID=A0A6A5SGK5_9PLEO|nr:hypothetical protein EJ02DRAFT_457480 [Clathrospora elynae]